MRLFIAVNFSEEVKAGLLRAMEELKQKTVSGNFTRPDNLHLTLAFLGETGDVAAAKRAVDCSAVPAFPMTVGGFGHFGSLYWAGIAPNPALSDMTARLRDQLRENGFRIEKRAFQPHITLAREVRANCRLCIEAPQVTMTVDRLSLMKSERIGGRLTYTEVYGKPLCELPSCPTDGKKR